MQTKSNKWSSSSIPSTGFRIPDSAQSDSKEYGKVVVQNYQKNVVAHGPHRIQLIIKHTCIMFINTPGFKLPIEPEGNMSIRRTNTPIGAEYHVTFSGSEEWEYLKAVFAAFAFMGKI